MPERDDLEQLRPESLRLRVQKVLREDAELRHLPVDSSVIADEVVRRRQALASKLVKEIDAAVGAPRAVSPGAASWVSGAVSIAALIGLIILVFNQDEFAVVREWPAGWYRLALAGLAVPPAALLRWQSLVERRRAAAVAAALDRLSTRIELEVRALIRQIVNELESDERVWGHRFEARVAPALIEIDMADTVSSTTFKKLQAFIAAHHTSAIGLAGPRGAGKSTLMEQLRYDEELNCLSVRIPAPVYYNAHELVRLIHMRLIRQILGNDKSDELKAHAIPHFKRLLAPAVKMALVVVSCLVLVVLWRYEQTNQLAYDDRAGFQVGTFSVLAIVGLSATAGVILFKAWRAMNGRSQLLMEPDSVRQLAWQQLHLLRWAVETQSTARMAVDMAKLSAEREKQIVRRERELTHAESVDLLREFLADLARLSSRRRVLVCIDELDKVADPEQAVEMINGIKDLFHIPHVHFLVSVSTDAMHRFAARGVPVRDVFDSSFDTIIQTSRLSHRESRFLIARRATDFCVPAVFFCHAWSGGHARDLIRAARSCVDVRREGDEDRELLLHDLVEAVLRKDIREVVDAGIDKVNRTAAPLALEGLLNLREMLDRPNPFTAMDLSADWLDDVELTVAFAESQALVDALLPYLRLARILHRFFAPTRTPTQWQSDDMSNMLEQLATIRSALTSRTYEAERMLGQLESAWADDPAGLPA